MQLSTTGENHLGETTYFKLAYPRFQAVEFSQLNHDVNIDHWETDGEHGNVPVDGRGSNVIETPSHVDVELGGAVNLAEILLEGLEGVVQHLLKLQKIID